MNYQINNIIVVIFVIYILNFYQINCDNKTISVNNVSDSNNNGSISTSSKPVQLEGVELNPQSSGSIKIEEFADLLRNKSSTHEGSTVPIKPKIVKKPEVRDPPPPPSQTSNTQTQQFSENDMAVKSSERPVSSTQPTNAVVVEPAKANTTALTSNVTLASKIATTSTTNTSTSITTAKPTKPHQTIAVDELPEPPAKPSSTKPDVSSSNMTINNDSKVNATQPTNTTLSKIALPIETPLHSVEEFEGPNVQSSKEQIPIIASKRDYIIPVVALIFAIPIVLAIATIMFRRAKDYWETRHYRRMDFLIDEMYND